MRKVKILTVPNPILRKKSKEISRFDAGLLNLIREMKKVLKNQKDPMGLGLSAVQIGVLKRVFLAKIGGKVQVFVNPKIVWRSKELTLGGTKENPFLEGCLSVPNYYGTVLRAKKVKIEFRSPEGEKRRLKLANLEARVVQHECDHLEGILFIDRILEQKGKLYKITKNRENKETLVLCNI